MSTLEFNDALIKMENYLKAFAMNYTRNVEDAEDLTQETMLKAIKYRSMYTPQTNFKAWVFTIMKNVFINQYRRKSKAKTIFDNSKEMYLLNNSTVSEENPSSYVTEKELNKKINTLNDEFKKPFRLHFEGFKYDEIAQKLGIPVGTVKSRIFLARKKMMEMLPEYNYLAN